MPVSLKCALTSETCHHYLKATTTGGGDAREGGCIRWGILHNNFTLIVAMAVKNRADSSRQVLPSPNVCWLFYESIELPSGISIGGCPNESHVDCDVGFNNTSYPMDDLTVVYALPTAAAVTFDGSARCRRFPWFLPRLIISNITREEQHLGLHGGHPSVVERHHRAATIPESPAENSHRPIIVVFFEAVERMPLR